MVDRVSSAARSAIMAAVRHENTAPEKLARSQLFAAGYRFRLHRRDLPGSPDIVLPRHRLAIFVHGCFWHGHSCPRGRPPKSNVAFWTGKVERNRARDAASAAALTILGWRVRVIWACQVLEQIDEIIQMLAQESGANRQPAHLDSAPIS
ncbi:MAG TPA: very short patch repair endonuclease [Stellaceae bacterium]|nr:very short patch repair endonuclease [Stellaceae bacterium]